MDVVSDETDRAGIAEVIAHLKARHDRMPAHWVDRRLEVMGEIDELVTDWIAAEA